MKICSICKLEKSLSDFSKAPTKKDGYSYKCKECQRKYSKTWYSHNSVNHIKNVGQNNRKYRDRLEKIVFDYLKSHPCVDCGEDDIFVLDFDHVRGIKRAPISNLVHRKWTEASFWKEINKCEIRCANCHRRQTNLRNKNNWKWKYINDSYTNDRSRCIDCTGITHTSYW